MQHELYLLLKRLYSQNTWARYGISIESFIAQVQESVNKVSIKNKKKSDPKGADITIVAYGDQVTQHQNIKPLDQFLQFSKNFQLSKISNRIHLLPSIFPNNADRGFAVSSYTQIDPKMGSWKTVEEIITYFGGGQVDMVMGHSSNEHKWFKEWRKQNPKYKYYYISRTYARRKMKFSAQDIIKIRRPRTSAVFQHHEKTILDTKPVKKIKVWSTFSLQQPDLNYQNPKVLLSVIKIILHYISHRFDTIRMDAVTYLWKKVKTDCANLPPVHLIIQILRIITDEVSKQNQQKITLLTETNVAHQENIQYFSKDINQPKAHMVYNFALPPLLFYSLATQDITELEQFLQKWKHIPKNCFFLNFIASHDGFGVSGVKDFKNGKEIINKIIKWAINRNSVISMKSAGDKFIPYEINGSLIDLLKNNIRQFIAVHLITFVIQGKSLIYFPNLFALKNNYDEFDAKNPKTFRSLSRGSVDEKNLNTKLKNKNSNEFLVFYGLKKIIQILQSNPDFSPEKKHKSYKIDKTTLAIERGNSLAIIDISEEKNIKNISLPEKWKDNKSLLNLETKKEIIIKNGQIEFDHYIILRESA